MDFGHHVDVLIPTYCRPDALAVTLTSLCLQEYRNFSLIISDQSPGQESISSAVVESVLRLLTAQGHKITLYHHHPAKGMAEQRQFLLEQATAPMALFLDDDLILENFVLESMVSALLQEQCGFVGCAPVGLSFLNDVRPHEQDIEFWDDVVCPESVVPGQRRWERYKLHNAANIYHVAQKHGLSFRNQRKYRVAWVGACVLYDTAKLKSVGGFGFWSKIPAYHCGEEVFVQMKLMQRYGGCGLIPPGVYHQELATTIPNRSYNVPREFAH